MEYKKSEISQVFSHVIILNCLGKLHRFSRPAGSA